MKSWFDHSQLYVVGADGKLSRKFNEHANAPAQQLKQYRMANGELRTALTRIRATMDEGATLTDVQRVTLASIQSELDALQPAIMSAELHNEDLRRQAAVADRNGSPHVDGDTEASTRAARAAGIAVRTHLSASERLSGSGQRRTFAQLFPNAHASSQGQQFDDPREFLVAVGRGGHDPRLRYEASAMSSQDDPSGGYAVPVEMAREWLDAGLESEIIRPRANVWGMTTRERFVPAFDVTDRSDGDIGGLTLQWESESGQMDLQAAKTRKVKLVAHKGAILAEASNELLADGLGFSAQLDAGIRRALSYGLDRSFLYGIGRGQPLGVFTSGALITVSKAVGQTAATIIYDNLVNMFARMLPSSVPNAVWIAHPSTIPQLATLSMPIGTGGTHIPVMHESNGSFTILTRPVIFSDKAKPLGQKGDIGLFDFSQYIVGLRAEMGLEQSQHVGFTRDMATFKLTIRIDGQPNIEAPYQLPDSAPSVSPFVALEART